MAKVIAKNVPLHDAQAGSEYANPPKNDLFSNLLRRSDVVIYREGHCSMDVLVICIQQGM
jgi:hypothetical protein